MGQSTRCGTSLYLGLKPRCSTRHMTAAKASRIEDGKPSKFETVNETSCTARAPPKPISQQAPVHAQSRAVHVANSGRSELTDALWRPLPPQQPASPDRAPASRELGEFLGELPAQRMILAVPARTLPACDVLLEWFSGGDESRKRALEAICGSIPYLAFQPEGCWVVQKALEVADRQQLVTIVAELHGYILTAIQSPHANHVVQKIIETMPSSTTNLIAEELRGLGIGVARHRYGCRIVSRMAEHHACKGDHTAEDWGVDALFHEILDHVDELSRHTYGRHALNSLLEHGSSEMQSAIVSALRRDLAGNAKNRNASFVMERALRCCSEGTRDSLVEELFGDRVFPSVAESRAGSFVVNTLLALPEYRQRTQSLLQSFSAQVSTSKYGRRLLEGKTITAEPEF